MPPPRVGAGQLWLALLALAFAVSHVLQALPPLPGRGSAAHGASGDANTLLRRRDGRRVVLLALPRSGGGALCRLAADNGEAARAGCAPAGGRGTVRALREGAPAAQCAALRAQPLSFLSLDASPDAPWLDAGALFVAALREPRARYVSELRALLRRADAHRQGGGEWPWELTQLGLNASDTASLSLSRLLAATSAAPASALPHGLRDNAAVRALAGAAARAAPDGALTNAHLQGAMRLLEAVDAVLLTERLQRDVTRLAQLAGWYFFDVTRKDRLGERQRADESAQAAAALSGTDAALLAERTALDAALYAHAAALGAARAQGSGGATAPRRPLRRCEELEGAGLTVADGAPMPADAPWGEGWAAVRQRRLQMR